VACHLFSRDSCEPCRISGTLILFLNYFIASPLFPSIAALGQQQRLRSGSRRQFSSIRSAILGARPCFSASCFSDPRYGQTGDGKRAHPRLCCAQHKRGCAHGKTTPYGRLDRGADTCFNHSVLQIARIPNGPQVVFAGCTIFEIHFYPKTG